MGEKRRRTRINCKIDNLPDDIKQETIAMISDSRNTYVGISLFLKEKGFDISYGAVGRYSIRMGAAMKRLQEAQEQAKALVEVVKQNPDVDYTDAGFQIMTGELTKRFAAAEEEWENMPLDKAGRLMVAASRTFTYKEKFKAEQHKKADIAFKEMESKILSIIGTDKADAAELSRILSVAKEKMMKND